MISFSRSALSQKFDASLFENISYGPSFRSHKEIASHLKNKKPYTITVIIESLKDEYRNRRKFVKKTKESIISKYKELLYSMLTQEYGMQGSNSVYATWIEKYNPIHKKEKKYPFVDEYIIQHELEPRYRQKIMARFTNHDQLFKDRIRIDRVRYYNLPEPLNHIDWRNSYDNIFVWEENKQKTARRGGSGSSGGREINSMFIYGLLQLNKAQPVPSYLFLYSNENKLHFIRKFDSLCVPAYDIGSNYDIDHLEAQKLKSGGIFFKWDGFDILRNIEIV